MTLLSVANDASDELQLARLSSIALNNDPGARRLLRYANSAGTQLSREWDWQALRREQTFTAVAGQTQTAAVPADFQRFVPQTFYDRTNDRPLIGPIGEAEWQAANTHDYQGVEKKVLYRNGALLVLPGFDGGESCVFGYQSSQWCEDSGGTGQTTMQADTDVSRIDEELLTLAVVALWLQSEGLPSAHIIDRYKSRWQALTKQDEARSRVLVSGDIFGGSRYWTGERPARNYTKPWLTG